MSKIGDEVKKLYAKELEDVPIRKKKRKRISVKSIVIISLILFIVWHVILGFGIIYYNQFVSFHQAILAQKGKIEIEFKRRIDLIPNLIKVAGDYAKHERELFHYVSDARSLLENANKLAKEKDIFKDKAMRKKLEHAFSNLIALAEQYPDLKATQSFQDLMDRLEDTENRIATAREKHIALVRDYNTLLVTFPSSFFNWIYRFEDMQYFHSEEASVPKIGVSDSLLYKE
jgi:LemA protein